MTLNVKETELNIPISSKQLIKRPRTALISPRYTKNPLFDPETIETEAMAFDILNSGAGEGDVILDTKNPRLLAIRNKSRLNSRPPSSARGERNRYKDIEIVQPRSVSSLLKKRAEVRIKDQRATLSEKMTKNLDDEKNALEFGDDPIAYFSKKKDGRGHKFIYLNYVGDRKDPHFNPYELVKVPFAEIHDEYFTMSANGVSHLYPNGITETVSIDIWTRNASNFAAIRKLRVFSQFLYWKPFKIWRNFVIRQHYNNSTNIISSHQYFCYDEFFKNLTNLVKIFVDENSQMYIDTLIDKSLLAFHPQRRYGLDQFFDILNNNIENLKVTYADYIHVIKGHILRLDAKIRDPKNVLVKDSDFPEIKRRNPNLDQLMVLEKKKAERRVLLTEKVNKQIFQLGLFIRQVDYFLLEELGLAIRKAWLNIGENVSQQMSSIFNIEVSYDDEGEIQLKPSLDDLRNGIKRAFDMARKAIKSLNRIVNEKELGPHIRESHPNFKALYKDGPNVEHLFRRYAEMDDVENNVIKIIEDSYRESEISSRVFSDFYHIYQLGISWCVDDYIKTRSGKKPRSLSVTSDDGEDDLDFDREPIVDINEIRKDLLKFSDDEKRLSQFIPCTVRGALYIDSKNLRHTLGPIPLRTQQKIISTLNELLNGKIDRCKIVLNKQITQLKLKPDSLKKFVEYVKLISKVEDTIVHMDKEESFIEQLLSFVMEVNSDAKANEQIQNPIPQLVQNLMLAKNEATDIRDNLFKSYVEDLEKTCRRIDEKIEKYIDKANTMPNTIAEVRVDQMKEQIKVLSGKIIRLTPQVEEALHFQDVLKVEFSKFSDFSGLIELISHAEKLYDAIDHWKNIERSYLNVAFIRLDTSHFKADLMTANSYTQFLNQSMVTSQLILTELNQNVDSVAPYVDSIILLFESSLQPRHWTQILNEISAPITYNSEKQLGEFVNIQLFKHTEVINRIAEIARSEASMQKVYEDISTKWNSVSIPVANNTPKSDDSLILQDVDPIINDIIDSVKKLKNIASQRFIECVTDQVVKLQRQLEQCAVILKAWYRFQENWLIVNSLFVYEESRSTIASQNSKLNWVRRRWASIIKHSNKDFGLFKVCQYPSLLDITNENNNILEQIISSLSNFIENKRVNCPRLFALGDMDIISLISYRDINTLTRLVPRLFMDFKGIDINGEEQQVNINRVKVYGITTKIGDTVLFNKPQSISGPIDVWVKGLGDMLRVTYSDLLTSYMYKFQSMQVTDWILTVPVHVAFTLLNVYFVSHVDECFKGFEGNINVFNHYEGKLKSMFNSVVSMLDTPLSPAEVAKASGALVTLTNHIDLVRQFTESPQTSFWWWNQLPKLRYFQQEKLLRVQYCDVSYEYDYELWGNIRQFIITQQTMKAIVSVINTSNPIIIGCPETGRRSMIEYLSQYFGRFLATIPCYKNMSKEFVVRILTSIVSSGYWGLFKDAHMLDFRTSSLISDILFDVKSSISNQRQTISLEPNKVININSQNRIFFTTGPHFSRMPSQLRSQLKPIALSAPEKKAIIEVKLSMFGVKNAKIIASKLSSIVLVISDTLLIDSKSFSSIHHINKVIEISGSFIRQTKEPTFRGIFDTIELLEDYIFAKALYIHFSCQVNDISLPNLISIIYAQFKFTDSFETFGNFVQRNKLFTEDTEHEVLENALIRVCQDLPERDYVVSKALNLYQLLKAYRCVVIHGCSTSRKSMIIDVLKYAIDGIMSDNVAKSKMNCHNEIKTIRLYFRSDSPSNFCGKSFQIADSKDPPIWVNGKLDTYISQLYRTSSSDVNHILVLDGPLNHDFEERIMELTSLDRSYTSSMNVLTFDYPGRFNIIVETDDISCIRPGLLSPCGFLNVKSIQDGNTDSCEIINVGSLVSRVFRSTQDENISKFAEEIFPPTVKYMFNTPNCLCYLQSSNNMFGAKDIMSNHIPEMALKFLSGMITLGYCNINNTEILRFSMIVAVFRVFSSLLSVNEFYDFDKWLRSTFKLSIVNSTGYNTQHIPEAFIETYPYAGLATHCIYDSTLSVVDTKYLEIPPIIPSKSELYAKKITVPTSEMANCFYNLDVAIATKMPVIIINECGVSSFLNVYFNERVQYQPVYFPSDSSISTEGLIRYLVHTTSVSSTFIDETKKYVLIFKDISSENTELHEFIRMICEEKTIPFTSVHNPNYLDLVRLHDYTVIVTTREYGKLPARLLSKMMPVRLDPTSVPSTKRIIQQILEVSNVETSLVNSITSFINQFIAQINGAPHYPRLYINIIDPITYLKERGCTSDKEKEVTIKTFLNQFLIHFVNSNPSTFRAFEQLFLDQFDCKDAFFEIESKTSMFINGFEVSRNGKYIANGYSETYDQIREELSVYIQVYNNGTSDKIDIKLFDHVIKYWRLIRHSLIFPSGCALLTGYPSSGRFTLARFISHMLQYDFVNITETPYSPVDLDYLKAIIRDVCTNCALLKKKCTLFIRHSSKHISPSLRLVLDFYKSQNFSMFFSNEHCLDFCMKFSNKAMTKPETVHAAYEEIRKTIKENLHILISVDPGACPLHEFREMEILFEEPTPNDYTNSAQLIISNPALDALFSEYRDVLPAALSRLHIEASKIIEYQHQNVFYDFLDNFVSIANKDWSESVRSGADLLTVVTFFCNIKNEAYTLDKQFEDLNPNLEKMNNQYDSLNYSYNTKREGIDKRIKELDIIEAEKSQRVRQLQATVDSLKNRKESIELTLSQNKNHVYNLTDNDVETLRQNLNAEPIPQLLILLFDVICIFLGMPASFERHGCKLLKDNKFVSIILSRIDPSNVQTTTLQSLESYFKREDFTSRYMDEISPTMRIIFDWIDSVYNFSLVSHNLIMAELDLQTEKDALNALTEENNNERKAMKEIEDQIELENKTLISTLESKESLEKHADSVEIRRKIVHEVMNNMDELIEVWSKKTEDVSARKENLIAKAIIFAYHLTYGAMVPLEKKKFLIDVAFCEVKNLGFMDQFDNILQWINSRILYDTSNPDLTFNSAANIVFDSAFDIYLTQLSIRIPLLIDNDGLARTYFEKSNKHNKYKIISVNSVDLDQILSISLRDGWLLVIEDFDFLHPFIGSILTLYRVITSVDEVKSVRIGSKIVPIHKDFKLILITKQKTIKDIPLDLISRCSVIDFDSYSFNATRSLIMNSILGSYLPDVLPRYNALLRSQMENRVNIDIKEKDIIDTIVSIVRRARGDPEYVFTQDDSALADIKRAKSLYFDVLFRAQSFEKEEGDVFDAVGVFNDIADSLLRVWTAISRYLPRLSSLNSFSFDSFLAVLSSSMMMPGYPPGQIRQDQAAQLTITLVQQVLKWILPSISQRDGIVLMFVISFLEKCSKGKARVEDLDVIVSHISSELTSSVDLSGNDLGLGDPLDHLKFTNIINVYTYISRAISDYFGNEFLSILPPFEPDSIITPAPIVPSIVLYSSTSPIPMLDLYLSTKTRGDNFIFITLDDDTEYLQNSNKIILMAMNKGYKCLVNFVRPSFAVTNYVNGLFTLITNSSVHSNFRLIILANRECEISSLLLHVSSRSYFDDGPFVRNTVHRLFGLVNGSIQVTNDKFVSLSKKVSYSLLLCYALTHYRRFFDPFGYRDGLYVSEDIIRVYISHMCQILEDSFREIPFKILREIVLDLVLGSSVMDVFDRRKLRSLVYTMYSSRLVEEGYTFCGDTQDSEKLRLPGDGPIYNIYNLISRLPQFPSAESLLITTGAASQVRLWFLSRYISDGISKLSIRQSITSPERIDIRISNFLMSIPEKISINSMKKFSTSVSLIMRDEIICINNLINDIRYELLRPLLSDDALMFINGNVPSSWCDRVSCVFPVSSQKFLTFLTEKRNFLLKYIQTYELKEFNACYISNIRGLLHTLLIDVSAKKNVPIESLMLDFQPLLVGRDQPGNSIIIKGLKLLNGTYSKETDGIEIGRSSKMIQEFPDLLVTVTKFVSRSKMFMCPLLRTVYISEVSRTDNYNYTDGQPDNLIWYIPLNSGEGPIQTVSNSTCLVCSLPEQLS